MVYISVDQSELAQITARRREIMIRDQTRETASSGNNTFPVNTVALSHFFFIVGVSFHVGKHSGLVGPQVVVGTKEMDWEFANVVPPSQDVFWNVFRVANFCRPPSNHTQKKKNFITRIKTIISWLPRAANNHAVQYWRDRCGVL